MEPEIKIQDSPVNTDVNPNPTFLRDIFGTIEVVSVVPTHIPRNAYEQIKVYVDGSDVRLYLYEPTNGWSYKTFDNT